ncbi:alpha-amylase family glycosyl hydrolase [Aestuariibacter sp. AA17]|uniref:Alpha-amylase n=2 Tax=Fluctibacter corallii TaxID=2984329 RepID=A0ABT3ADC3_9ALTE|nr:alpha-amylase family glycosyl hydrolase [Aestuariibacter sp. AA17]
MLGGCSSPDTSHSSESEKDTLTYLHRDLRDENFYFVMPDRFNNGNPDNDLGSKTHAISQGGLDVTSKWAFHGGDMQGLEEKLDYLKGMGITAIWMTPILRNQAVQEGGFGHHGYWIVDFTEIDPHFGTNDDLKSLIHAAHKKDIKIFFDIITNHTADIIRYQECHNSDGTFKGEHTCPYKSMQDVANGDTYTPFIPDHLKEVKHPAWLNDPKYYNNQGDSFWQGESAINGDFAGLDDLNTRDPNVVSGMVEIYQNLITEFKPDGFRIDTVKHVDMSFWKDFAPKIVEHAQAQGIPNFHIFGEVYDGNAEVLSSFTTEGTLPSVLDFGFQHAAAEVFYRGSSTDVIAKLINNDDFYSDADSNADLLMNFLGNHDMGRPGLFINRATPDASEDEKLKRSVVSHGFMYFSRGIPVVYYGDEQGFTGDAHDVDAREDMFPSHVASYNDNNLLGTSATTADNNFDTTHPLYTSLAYFAHIRASQPALRRGVMVNRNVTNNSDVFAFSRIDEDEQKEVLAVFNPTTAQQTAQLTAYAAGYEQLSGEGDVNHTESVLLVSLPPLSYSLLKATDKAPIITDLSVKMGKVEETASRVILPFTVPSKVTDTPSILRLELFAGDNIDAAPLVTDYHTPYQAILSKAQYRALKGKRITVKATNGEGASQLHTFTL